MTLHYAELFAGAGGLSLGLDRAGMKCRWHAEIEDFPRRVLRARWPDTPLYGDVRELDGRALVEAHGAIDLISGGAPCQDLSVAGKRAGLQGDRSILFYQLIRLWEETGAELCLYENVAGALSSNDGKDFAAVLSAFVGGTVPVPRDGWSGGRRAGVVSGPSGVASWRCLDAQYVGLEDAPAVPQRRLRVFVLGARTGRIDPAEVLLELEGVFGDTPPRRKAGEGAARRAEERLGGESGRVTAFEPRYYTRDNKTGGAPSDLVDITNCKKAGDSAPAIVEEPKAYGFNWQNGGGYGTANDGLAIVEEGVGPLDRSTTKAVVQTEPTPLDMRQLRRGEKFTKSGRPGGEFSGAAGFGMGEPGDPSYSLGAEGGAPGVVAFDGMNQKADEVHHALRVGQDSGDHVVSFKPAHYTRGKNGAPSDIMPPLTAEADRGDQESVVLAIDFAQVTHPENRSQPQPQPLSPSLNAKGDIHVFNETGHEKWSEEPIAGSLNAHEAREAREAHTMVLGGEDASPDVAGTLDARHAGGFQTSQSAAASHLVPTHGIPRRLMPIECERLMGWEDNWTDVPDEKGKPASDSQRYKACGNGVVSHVSQWIGERILWAWNRA